MYYAIQLCSLGWSNYILPHIYSSFEAAKEVADKINEKYKWSSSQYEANACSHDDVSWPRYPANVYMLEFDQDGSPFLITHQGRRNAYFCSDHCHY